MARRPGSFLSLLVGLCAGCAAPPYPTAHVPGGRGATQPVDRTVRVLDAIQGDEVAPPTEPDPGPRFRTFSIRGGAQFVADFSSKLRLDSRLLGVGTEIKLEDDLGFDSSTQFARIDATWRFNRWHAIDASYFSFGRTASRTIDQDIVWGPITIPAGSGVNARLDLDTAKLAYRYTFLTGDEWELAGSIGVHATRLGTGLSGARSGIGADFAVTVPLPVLGLRGGWELTPGLRMNGLLDFFYIQLEASGGDSPLESLTGADRFEGYLLDALLTLEYDLFDNVGIGVGGNYFILDASAGDDLLELSANYHYAGALAFMSVSF